MNFSQNSFAIFKSSQIEEKRHILNIVFANFFMDGKKSFNFNEKKLQPPIKFRRLWNGAG